MALVGFALGGALDGRTRLPPTPAGVPAAGVPVSGMLAAIGHFRAAQTTGPSQAQALQLTIGRTIGHGLVQPAVQATTASGSARTQAPSRPSIAATCAPTAHKMHSALSNCTEYRRIWHALCTECMAVGHALSCTVH